MNINEYIEKYSKIVCDEEKRSLELIMCVPPRKIVEFKWQEGNDTKRVKIDTKKVIEYLDTKGFRDMSLVKSDTLDNSHPKGLTAHWIFKTPYQKWNVSEEWLQEQDTPKQNKQKPVASRKPKSRKRKTSSEK
tara:strand:- start:486 stop:884 length:399 start_codon:yes stop_codon:yes gene_type:complete